MMANYGCDVFVVLPPFTDEGAVIFGKNADLPPKEIEEIAYFPAVDNKDAQMNCTYISVDQVSHSYAIMVTKAGWSWGCESGANEHGVVIGSVALHSKLRDIKDTNERLLDIDLVRLGLERGKTAKEALDVLIHHVEKYGQGGRMCESEADDSYDSGFIIADRTEAWILETSNIHWAAKAITDGYCNHSNHMIITDDYTLLSSQVEEATKKAGLWDGEGKFNFAQTLSLIKWESTTKRYNGGCQLVKQHCAKEKFTVSDMIAILRNKETGICRTREEEHATMTSQISMLPKSGSKTQRVHFFTGLPDPSTCGYKAFIFADEKSDAAPEFVRCPTFDDDPAKTIPRFQRQVDRRHRLYCLHEQVIAGHHPRNKSPDQVISAVQKMETDGVQDVIAALRADRPIADPESLFRDCTEAELKMYKY